MLNVIQNTFIFQFSENYDNPTHVTKFKIAVNMVNPNSLMKKPLVLLISSTKRERKKKSFPK